MDIKKIVLIIVLSFVAIFGSCVNKVVVGVAIWGTTIGVITVGAFNNFFEIAKERSQEFEKTIAPLDNFVNEFHAIYNREEYSELYKASGEVKTRLTEEDFAEIFTEFTEKLGKVKNSTRNKTDVSKKSGTTVIEMVYQTSFSSATTEEKFTFIVNENKATLYSYDIKLIDTTSKENVENNFNSLMKNTNVFKFFTNSSTETNPNENPNEAQLESQKAGEEYLETAEFESQEATK
jgi:hypothetical protein